MQLKHIISEIESVNARAKSLIAEQEAFLKKVTESRVHGDSHEVAFKFQVGYVPVTTMEEVVSLAPAEERLELVGRFELGETRTVTIEESTVTLGKKTGYVFLRSADLPTCAALLSDTPSTTDHRYFSPDPLAYEVRQSGLFKGMMRIEGLPRYALATEPTCQLCKLGIKHSRHCLEDQRRIIADAAQDHGITHIITNSMNDDDASNRRHRLSFRDLSHALSPRSSWFPCTSDFCGDDHRPLALIKLMRHLHL